MMSRFNLAHSFIGFQTASDGFFLNLSWVTLRLAAPIMGGKKSRFLAIDSSYCSATKEQLTTVDSEGPLVDFSGESKLVPVSSEGGCVEVIM